MKRASLWESDTSELVWVCGRSAEGQDPSGNLDIE